MIFANTWLRGRDLGRVDASADETYCFGEQAAATRDRAGHDQLSRVGGGILREGVGAHVAKHDEVVLDLDAPGDLKVAPNHAAAFDEQVALDSLNSAQSNPLVSESDRKNRNGFWIEAI